MRLQVANQPDGAPALFVDGSPLAPGSVVSLTAGSVVELVMANIREAAQAALEHGYKAGLGKAGAPAPDPTALIRALDALRKTIARPAVRTLDRDDFGRIVGSTEIRR